MCLTLLVAPVGRTKWYNNYYGMQKANCRTSDEMTVKDGIGPLEGVLTVRVDSRNPKTSVRYTPEALRLSQELWYGKLSGETRGWISKSEIDQHFNTKGKR